mgnify:CR=1 FL=1
MSDNKESAKSTRQKAAEARATAQAAERRRERMIRIVGGLAVLVVVVGIIAIGITQRGGKSASTDTPSADSPLPTGISADNGYGFQVSTAANKPDVVIFEDFQCPACANFEQTYGPAIQELAAAGDIALTYRIMTFLDNNLQTDHSSRAASAFGCSIDAGAGEAYHNTIYANQPQTEGAGWTDDQLKTFGTDAGITGEAKTTFDTCVDEGTYQGWAGLSNQAAFDSGVTGTPTIEVNGEKIPDGALANEQALREALTNPAQ